MKDARSLVTRSMTEAQLQHFIIGTEKEPGLAVVLGWTVYHVRDSRKQMVVGLPDLLLCRPPVMEWWELKREQGRTTTIQEQTMALLTNCGQKTRVMRPSDWVSGEIERVLKGAP